MKISSIQQTVARMHVIDQPPAATSLDYSVLRALAWFDLFHYPLPLQEIHFFLERPCTINELKQCLHRLVEDRVVFCLGNYYALHDNPQMAGRRTAGNQRAKKLLAIAHRIGRLLYHCPYVRGIGISGSLSKNFADEKADIDFFIITRTNRLWIARTAMHILKKLAYLAGRQHWFCMNYYIDEEALLIQEQNIFTATELITLMPVCGKEAVRRFYESNTWAAGYLPQYTVRTPPLTGDEKRYHLKQWLEYLCNGSLGNRLENFLQQLTARRWKQKENKQQRNMHGTRMGLVTGPHYAKPNPGYFQKNILEQYQLKVETVLASYQALQTASTAR